MISGRSWRPREPLSKWKSRPDEAETSRNAIEFGRSWPNSDGPATNRSRRNILMSNNSGVNSPDHLAARAMLRMIGPGVALIGLVLVVVGVASFFAAFGTFEMPKYFWCAFVGIPLLGVGLIMSQFGFLGSIFRY